MPTKAELKQAFRQANITDSHRKILRAHYGSRNKTATAAELAVKVGYEGHSGINRHYGELAKRVRFQLSIKPVLPRNLDLLVEVTGRNVRGVRDVLKMRSEVIAIIEEMRIV